MYIYKAILIMVGDFFVYLCLQGRDWTGNPIVNKCLGLESS